jgi:hypothetical protein
VGFEHTIPVFEEAKMVHALDPRSLIDIEEIYEMKIKYYTWIASDITII